MPKPQSSSAASEGLEMASPEQVVTQAASLSWIIKTRNPPKIWTCLDHPGLTPCPSLPGKELMTRCPVMISQEHCPGPPHARPTSLQTPVMETPAISVWMGTTLPLCPGMTQTGPDVRILPQHHPIQLILSTSYLLSVT